MRLREHVVTVLQPKHSEHMYKLFVCMRVCVCVADTIVAVVATVAPEECVCVCFVFPICWSVLVRVCCVCCVLCARVVCALCVCV